MSEKRFVLIEDDLEPLILDNKETMSVNEVVDKLNEQQSKITELEIELTDCKNRKEQSEYNLHKKIRELEKIPQSIREVWIDEQETE